MAKVRGQSRADMMARGKDLHQSRSQYVLDREVRAHSDLHYRRPEPKNHEFETLMRLADPKQPPRCPQCGSKGAWRHRVHIALFTHWVCQRRSKCGWEAIAADDCFRQGVPGHPRSRGYRDG